MLKDKLKSIFTLFKVSVMEFLDDNCMKFSASLSYYTVFSIPPLAILIISSAGYFFGEEAVSGELFAQIQRSEEHTSELQSRPHLVCRLLLEKKKKINIFASLF